jgi:heme A synthase
MSSTPSTGFRRLAYLAVALTFALVIVGGIVRISDSGLGCGLGGSGTKGWPLCGGRVVPLIDTNMIVEYTHRLLAASLTIVIATLALLCWRRYRDQRRLLRATFTALALVIFQAALGGLTVEKGLQEELVAAHLGVAMLQLGLLILVARLTSAASARGSASSQPAVVPSAPAPPASQGIRVLALAAAVAVLGTIVAGGYMSASELHGTGKSEPTVHTACGNDFPSCGGEFLPFGRSHALDVHLTHRAFMYVAFTLVLMLFVVTLFQSRQRKATTDPSLTRAVSGAFAVLCIQVLLGALNVWLGEHAWLVVAHLAVGTLVWSALVLVTMLALRVPRPAVVVARGEAKVQAVPA